MNRLLLLFVLVLVGCGKVAQDVSPESTEKSFKEVTLTTDLSLFSTDGWSGLMTIDNKWVVYAYAQGLEFGKGYERMGYSNAVIINQSTVSKNAYALTNFDKKKNTITSARYQQGLFKVQQISSQNFTLKLTFNKLRPKYDYYSFVQYTSKDDYLFKIQSDISTKNITITPYDHVVSTAYVKHLENESYNRDLVIPLTHFYEIVPTKGITVSSWGAFKNSIKKFKETDPLFSIQSTYIDSIIMVAQLSYQAEKYDVMDYLEAIETSVFTEELKQAYVERIDTYFESKAVPTNNVFPSANITQE